MTEHRQAFFQELVEANRRRLAGIARSYAAPADRDDLLQEMLLQLWKSLPRFEGRSSVETWVYRVGLNTALTWRRRQLRRPVEEPAPDQEGAWPRVHPAAAGEPGERDPVAILDEFILSLGEIDRAVFLLYLDDLSYRQIAEVTGLTDGAVGVRLHRLKHAFTARYIRA